MEDNNTKNIDNTVKELSDDELKNVTGGKNFSLHFFDTEKEVYFMFFPGEYIYVKQSIFSSKIRCRVLYSEVFHDPQYNCYVDLYYVIDSNNIRYKVLRDDIVNEDA